MSAMKMMCVFAFVVIMVVQNACCDGGADERHAVLRLKEMDSGTFADKFASIYNLVMEQSKTVSSLTSLLMKQQADIQTLKQQRQEQNLHIQEQHNEIQALKHLLKQFEGDAKLHPPPYPSAGCEERNVTRSTRSDDSGPLEVVVNQLSQKVTLMNADIQALQTTTSQQNLDIVNAQTSTFIHWGSASCPGSSELVYTGVVGGSPYGESGGATNTLCMTMSPVFGDPKSFPRVHVHGAEYETRDSHQDKDIVCSVCRAAFSTTIMIPGTNVCTPGWKVQYTGYIMAGDYVDPAGTEFICVDSALENTVNGDANNNEKVFYYAITQCGSLPCSPYENDKTVVCVVCAK